jgi:hypothetical protein
MFQDNVNQNKTFLLGSITQMDIVIQRPLQKLRKKTSVKHAHIDKNVNRNVVPFPLRFMPVLCNLCHFSNLVCFEESEPLGFAFPPYTDYTHQL